ncbi:MAG: hypothetical protein IKP53_06285 [Candidatus Methanomethylophilaceae archaeon]|nr:hypothetical protein [Candidatus Methanomethylophilaceae archaeon]MBR7006012.1 hypothetical protein [Candidatus Methanomethylophilaceae archaeon]
MNTQVNGPLVFYDKSFETGREEIRVYLESVLEISVVDETLLDLAVQAFTTPGYAKENPGLKDYERLEFLGDAIIKAHVSEAIFKRYSWMDEGRMSKLCQHLWNNKTYPFCIMENGADFHNLILVSKSDRSQDVENKLNHIASVVSDCYEALIGALEISTSFETCGRIIDKTILNAADALVFIVS